MAHRPFPARRPRRPYPSAGMTLVELMIVVVILAILAGAGFAGYSRVVRRSQTAEASTTLGALAAREDAYRQEFGQYCAAGRTDGAPPTALGVGNSWPSTAPGMTATPFLSGSVPREWRQLGFTPGSAVRYRYIAIAGTPTTVPPGEPGWSSAPNQDMWFIAEAYGDLDGDSSLATFRWYSVEPNRLRITNEIE